MTHYDTLGVRANASAAEIRDAYRALARRHHPDRGSRDAAAMAAINEAHRVISDPARRAVYDASLRPTASSPSPPRSGVATDAPRRVSVPVALPPARYPWKLVIAMFLLGATVVLVGAALYEPAEERPPDNLLESGSCVEIEVNGDAREVRCGGGDDLVVEVLVPTGERCPPGTAGHRDRQGRGVACVTPVP